MTLQKWSEHGWLRIHVSSRQEVMELIEIVEELRVDVLDWLKKNHPELLES